MNATAPERQSEQGFSLVETLIASAIVATMTALVFQGISANAAATRMVADRRAAAMIAKSALDMAMVGDATLNDRRTGIVGPYRWSVSTAPYEGSAGTAPSLSRIIVSVARANAAKPLIRISTLRVAR